MGELNSKLLGIIFIMKFQAAAMGRASIPEAERQDFSLFVDEFQNFSTDSFESILSEARKYRLNLILGNQFMTQLSDKVREAVIGNVGTVVSGRIGITDAEILAKKFQPTFDAEDLTKLPNHQSISSVMVNNVPSAPFSMSWIAPMGQTNAQLSDALKRLSAAKYGRPRAIVEKAIFERLGANTKAKPTSAAGVAPGGGAKSSGSSFLDEWLAKRQQLGGTSTPAKPTTAQPAPRPAGPMQPSPYQPQTAAPQPAQAPTPQTPPQSTPHASETTSAAQPEVVKAPESKLQLRGNDSNSDSEVSFKLR